MRGLMAMAAMMALGATADVRYSPVVLRDLDDLPPIPQPRRRHREAAPRLAVKQAKAGPSFPAATHSREIARRLRQEARRAAKAAERGSAAR